MEDDFKFANFNQNLLGEDPENLPYESFDDFDTLKSNPPFPTDFNDELDSEVGREKRDNSKTILSKIFPKKNENKMDEKIRDDESLDNSKFHGFNVLNDLNDKDE